MLFALFTIAELPVWRDVVRLIPVAGITIQQRLRVFWALGAAVLAAIAVDVARPRDIRIALCAVWVLTAFIYATRNPQSAASWMTFAMSSSVAMLAFVAPLRVEILAALTFFELFAVTYRYNPSAGSGEVFPVTRVVAVLRSGAPDRATVVGWGLLPDTPAYYGIEDVKSTDPLSDPVYKRLVHGFLHVSPSYDEVFTDVSEPFLDALSIRYVYAPPGTTIENARFVRRYAGHDGSVYENTHVVPRYFIANRYKVNTFSGHAIASLKDIRDFRTDAVVDHVPSKTAEVAPQLMAHRVEEWRPSAGGNVRIVTYENNRTRLRAMTAGWSLLCSSDTNWPGWRAYVNGERQPTVTVNGAFLGVFVPPGDNNVEFRYRPAEFDMGLRVSITTAVALAVAFIIARRRR